MCTMRVGFLLAACFLYNAECFKFLVYNPIWSQSHTNFLVKLSEVLTDAGHEVVMLSPIVDAGLPGVEKARVSKVITVPPCITSLAFSVSKKGAAPSSAWASKSMIKSLQHNVRFTDVWIAQCNATINHPGLFETLSSEKFDAAFHEPIELCGYGIFHKLGIKSVAGTLSIGSYEGNFDATGLPSFPSYVPGMSMQFGERMSFLERVVNTISLGFGKYLFPYFGMPIEGLFKDKFGDDFPSMAAMKRATSLWFLNAEPLIEFPRPIIHKMIDIGGITVAAYHKELNETWSEIMSLRKQTVLISFGTVSKSYLMPDSYKKNIRNYFRKFPNVTFIWKYERPEHKMSEGIANLVEATWVPQIDMLYDSRLSLFITHCGQGSAIEATTAGVPLIVIPLLGDQRRNAAVINRIGTGIVMEKQSLEDNDVFERTLRSVLETNKYREKARSVGEMIRQRPFSPHDTFIRNMEFLAQFGPLRMLDHHGIELNFIQYYLIDVFTFLFIAVLFSCFACFFVVRLVVRSMLSGCWKLKAE